MGGLEWKEIDERDTEWVTQCEIYVWVLSVFVCVKERERVRKGESVGKSSE